MNPKASSIGVLVLIIGIIFFTQYHPDNSKPIPNYDTIKIANWNMQIFGESKANDAQLMNSYVEKIKNYDIIFLQEIRDESGISARSLCGMLSDYNCQISSRAGSTSNKEQYLVVYKKGITIEDFIDYNLLNYTDQFERPPIKVLFSINNSRLKYVYIENTSILNYTTYEPDFFNITIYSIHVKPEAVKKELSNLELLATYGPNTIILGDMNADCTYYDPENEQILKGWNWVIKDTADTTVGNTNCAYDRILTDNELALRISSSGIDTQVTPEQSDHYIVWVEIKKDNSG